MIPLKFEIAAVLLLVGVAVGGHIWAVDAAYDRGHAAAETERAARDAVAVGSRVTENVKVGEKQDKDNVIITEKKHEELAPVIRTIYVDRVRVGQGVCGPATASETQGTGGSNSTDPGPRLVSQRTEEDIRALEVKVEESFATGRACQAFLEKNGLTP